MRRLNSRCTGQRPASVQRIWPTIEAAGRDPDHLPARGAIDIGKDNDIGARESRPQRWKDIWSAGHAISGVSEILSVDEMVARTLAEYREADQRLGERL